MFKVNSWTGSVALTALTVNGLNAYGPVTVPSKAPMCGWNVKVFSPSTNLSAMFAKSNSNDFSFA